MTSLPAAGDLPATRRGGRRTPMLLSGFASGMSFLLFVVAAFVPIESVQTTARVEPSGPVPRETLVEAHGTEVLYLVAIPCLVSLLVTLMLAVALRKSSLLTCSAALVLSATTVLVALIGFVLFSILGFLLLPVSVCLLAASFAAYHELRRDAVEVE
jgi:hypothetical protein